MDSARAGRLRVPRSAVPPRCRAARRPLVPGSRSPMHSLPASERRPPTRTRPVHRPVGAARAEAANLRRRRRSGGASRPGGGRRAAHRAGVRAVGSPHRAPRSRFSRPGSRSEDRSRPCTAGSTWSAPCTRRREGSGGRLRGAECRSPVVAIARRRACPGRRCRHRRGRGPHRSGACWARSSRTGTARPARRERRCPRRAWPGDRR